MLVVVPLLLANVAAARGISIEDGISSRNDARRRVHAEAEAKREQLLDMEIREVAPGDHARPSLSEAGAQLRELGRTTRHQPALGPILLGAAMLCRHQAKQSGGCCWVLDRAALLNGGDSFVRTMVPLLCGPCGFYVHAAGLEGGADGARAIAFAVQQQRWTSAELYTLAAMLTHLAFQQPIGRRSCGCIEPRLATWRPRSPSSWGARAFAVVRAWRVRLWILFHIW